MASSGCEAIVVGSGFGHGSRVDVKSGAVIERGATARPQTHEAREADGAVAIKA